MIAYALLTDNSKYSYLTSKESKPCLSTWVHLQFVDIRANNKNNWRFQSISCNVQKQENLLLLARFFSHPFDLYCQDYEYPDHPQSTQHQKNDRCPPPPQMLPERACEVPGCRSDSECERHKRCCYNGCIYACLESVQPPPGQQRRRAAEMSRWRVCFTSEASVHL